MKLYKITDDGIEEIEEKDPEIISYLLNDSDEPHYADQIEALKAAISILSARVNELAKRGS